MKLSRARLSAWVVSHRTGVAPRRGTRGLFPLMLVTTRSGKTSPRAFRPIWLSATGQIAYHDL